MLHIEGQERHVFVITLQCLLHSPVLDDPDYRSEDLLHQAGVQEGVPVSTTDDVVLTPHLFYHVLDRSAPADVEVLVEMFVELTARDHCGAEVEAGKRPC